MPTIQITIDPSVVDALTSAGPETAVTLTVTVGSAATPPAVAAPAEVAPRGPLAPLLSGGVLRAGDRLLFRQPRAKRVAYATVRPDGRLNVDGKPTPFASPSRAASAITGSQINGWTLWYRESDGRTLAQLRDQLEASEDE